ncbi:MAG TPA: methionyl-tRNA formyltransferase [Vicinamibacterales bacterium]|nr:methionyl-tRNA formyltransferase [Vicinamibacterales bacterium]
MRSLRIVYFGTPEFAVPGLRALIASRHPVIALVSQPDRPKDRGHKPQTTPTKRAAEAAGVPVLQPARLKDEAFTEALRALEPDLGVVAAYGRIIPDAVLAIPRLGLINIHASLLPKYRGAAPVHRAVISGDPETGVTIMRIVTELDAGPTFASVRLPIGPDATTPDVERALAQAGADLVLEVVDQLALGSAVEVPQDDADATYAPKVERHEGAIEWTLPARRIHNLVRGLQPWPMVSAMVDGVRCLVHRTALTDQRTDATPGTITIASNGVLGVAAGDGRVLRLLEIQPEGKRVMPARDFLAGRRIAVGSAISRVPAG